MVVRHLLCSVICVCFCVTFTLLGASCKVNAKRCIALEINWPKMLQKFDNYSILKCNTTHHY